MARASKTFAARKALSKARTSKESPVSRIATTVAIAALLGLAPLAEPVLAQGTHPIVQDVVDFEVLPRNPRSSWQLPADIATLTVRHNQSMLLKGLQLRMMVRATALRTRTGQKVVPIQLARPDELEILLISPEGQTITVGKARRYRDEEGRFGSQLPVSVVQSGRLLRPPPEGAALYQVQPRVDELGLPATDTDGNLLLDEKACERPTWFGDPSGGPRFGLCDAQSRGAFEISRSQQPPEVRANLRTVPNPDPPGAHFLIEASLPVAVGMLSHGTWTLAVADSRPLLHDRLDPRQAPLHEINLQNPENLNQPLVPRLTVVEAQATFIGWRAPAGRIVYRKFHNELDLERPEGQELIGATSLIASGVEMDEIGAEVRVKPVSGPAEGPLQISIEAPDRRRVPLGTLPPEGGHLELAASSGIELQDWQRGRPIDGKWILHVEVLDADKKLQDRADLYFIAWSLTARGASTDWTGHAPEGSLRRQADGWREATFTVNMTDVARDAQVNISGVTGLEVRHALELIAPDGRRVAKTCRLGENPVEGRCLKVDFYGEGYRIALPGSTRATGTWTVRWRPEADPAAFDYQTDGAVSEEQSCEAGEGAIAVGPTRLFTALPSAAATGVNPVNISLGLSRSRLDPAALAHRIVDDGELRPRLITLFNQSDTGIRATVHHIARERYQRAFWSAWDILNNASAPASRIERLINQYRRSGADALSEHLGTVDALRAHVISSGNRTLLTRDLYAELTRPANFDVVNAMARFGPTASGAVGLHSRNSWLMQGYDPRDDGQVFRRVLQNIFEGYLERSAPGEDKWIPHMQDWIDQLRDPTVSPGEMIGNIVRDVMNETIPSPQANAESIIKRVIKMGGEPGLLGQVESAWEAAEIVGDALIESVAEEHYANEADKELHKFENSVHYFCGDSTNCYRQMKPEEGLIQEACSAGSTSPYCDLEEYQHYRPDPPEDETPPADDGGDGSDTETAVASNEDVGSPECTTADPDCDDTGNTYCGGQQDSCGAAGVTARTIMFQLERAQRMAWDKLYAQWGEMAPYVNCAGDIDCGYTIGQPTWVSDVGRLDPLIYCQAEEGVCQPNTLLAVCRSFRRVGGDIDPPRP